MAWLSFIPYYLFKIKEKPELGVKIKGPLKSLQREINDKNDNDKDKDKDKDKKKITDPEELKKIASENYKKEMLKKRK